MEEIKPRNSGTKELFKNPVLERLTRTHISVPITLFLLYSASLLYWSVTHTSLSIPFTVLMFFAGLLSFTLAEYCVHRFVFHMSTHTKSREKIQYTLHGIHHEYPKDKDRLAMPPLLSISLATALLFVFRLILGDLVFSFLPGFLVGYAMYLCVHYIVHVFAPPKNFLRVLWINHSVHHYKNGKNTFGVSSPLWDYIFGTMEEFGSKTRKAA